jgi:hypothetical protein
MNDGVPTPSNIRGGTTYLYGLLIIPVISFLFFLAVLPYIFNKQKQKQIENAGKLFNFLLSEPDKRSDLFEKGTDQIMQFAYLLNLKVTQGDCYKYLIGNPHLIPKGVELARLLNKKVIQSKKSAKSGVVFLDQLRDVIQSKKSAKSGVVFLDQLRGEKNKKTKDMPPIPGGHRAKKGGSSALGCRLEELFKSFDNELDAQYREECINKKHLKVHGVDITLGNTDERVLKGVNDATQVNVGDVIKIKGIDGACTMIYRALKSTGSFTKEDDSRLEKQTQMLMNPKTVEWFKKWNRKVLACFDAIKTLADENLMTKCYSLLTVESFKGYDKNRPLTAAELAGLKNLLKECIAAARASTALKTLKAFLQIKTTIQKVLRDNDKREAELAKEKEKAAKRAEEEAAKLAEEEEEEEEAKLAALAAGVTAKAEQKVAAAETVVEEVEVKAAEEVEVKAAEEVEVKAAEEVEVKAAEEVEVKAAEEVEVKAAEEEREGKCESLVAKPIDEQPELFITVKISDLPSYVQAVIKNLVTQGEYQIWMQGSFLAAILAAKLQSKDCLVPHWGERGEDVDFVIIGGQYVPDIDENKLGSEGLAVTLEKCPNRKNPSSSFLQVYPADPKYTRLGFTYLSTARYLVGQEELLRRPIDITTVKASQWRVDWPPPHTAKPYLCAQVVKEGGEQVIQVKRMGSQISYHQMAGVPVKPSFIYKHIFRSIILLDHLDIELQVEKTTSLTIKHLITQDSFTNNQFDAKKFTDKLHECDSKMPKLFKEAMAVSTRQLGEEKASGVFAVFEQVLGPEAGALAATALHKMQATQQIQAVFRGFSIRKKIAEQSQASDGQKPSALR